MCTKEPSTSEEWPAAHNTKLIGIKRQLTTDFQTMQVKTLDVPHSREPKLGFMLYRPEILETGLPKLTELTYKISPQM